MEKSILFFGHFVGILDYVGGKKTVLFKTPLCHLNHSVPSSRKSKLWVAHRFKKRFCVSHLLEVWTTVNVIARSHNMASNFYSLTHGSKQMSWVDITFSSSFQIGFRHPGPKYIDCESRSWKAPLGAPCLSSLKSHDCVN